MDFPKIHLKNHVFPDTSSKGLLGIFIFQIPMKILIDNTSFLPIVGGTETYCYQLLTNIPSDEAELRLLCQVPLEGPSTINGHRIVRVGDHGLPEGYHPGSAENDLALGMGRILEGRNDALESLERLKRTALSGYYNELIDFRPEIVLVNDLMRVVSVPYIQHACFITDSAMIVALHGILTSFAQIWDIKPEKKHLVDELLQSECPIYFVAPSKYVYDTALEWGFDENCLRHIYLGVDTSFFKLPSEDEKKQARATLASKFSKPQEFRSDEILIGFPSRAVDHKGVDIALRALQILQKRRPELEWNLIIAGGASDNPESVVDTETYIRKFGLQDRIFLGLDLFTGFPEDMKLFNQACDLCLFPSRREALGYGALESMSCGIPVVGTSIPGLSEALGVNPNEVKDCPGGWAVSPENPKALVDILEKILEDPSILESKGFVARKWIEKRFSLSRMIDQHLNYFKEIYEAQIG